MKSVLISIKPQWCEKIANGKIIGEFICDRIEDFSQWENDYSLLLRHLNLYAGTDGDYEFLDKYLNRQKKGYGWHISDLKIYDKPKEYRYRPPQSWQYVEEQGRNKDKTRTKQGRSDLLKSDSGNQRRGGGKQ